MVTLSQYAYHSARTRAPAPLFFGGAGQSFTLIEALSGASNSLPAYSLTNPLRPHQPPTPPPHPNGSTNALSRSFALEEQIRMPASAGPGARAAYPDSTETRDTPGR